MKKKSIEELAAECRNSDGSLRKRMKESYACFHPAYENENPFCIFQGVIIGGKYECFYGKKRRLARIP